MKAEWRTEKLGEVSAFVNRGGSPRYLEDGGICVLGQRCVRNHRIEYQYSRRHDARAKPVGEGRYVQAGDVLVNSTGVGSLGRVGQVRETPPEPTTVDSHVTIVRPRPGKFFVDFFGYMLVQIEDAITEAGEGCGGQTELNRRVLAERFSVSYPTSIDEQQRIVGKLDAAFAALTEAQAHVERNRANARELFESYLNGVFEGKGDGWKEYTLPDLAENLDSRRVPITKSDRKAGEYPYYGASGIVDYVHDFIFDEDCLLISEDGANLLMRSTPIAFSVSGKYWVNNHAHILRFRDKATQSLVEHYLESIDLDPWITGAAQPKLNQSAMNSIPIWLPLSVEDRRALVERLDNLKTETDVLETTYQQKLTELAGLKKAVLGAAFRGEL